MPPTWRAKYDLDGYIPMLVTKTRLIERVKQSNATKPSPTKKATKKERKITLKNRKTKIWSPHKEKVRGRQRICLYRAWVQPYA